MRIQSSNRVQNLVNYHDSQHHSNNIRAQLKIDFNNTLHYVTVMFLVNIAHGFGYNELTSEIHKVCTEQVSLRLSTWTLPSSGKSLVGANLSRDTGYLILDSRGFPQILHKDFGTGRRLGHYRLVPNPFRFILYTSTL
jgi:hypothetical protein